MRGCGYGCGVGVGVGVDMCAYICKCGGVSFIRGFAVRRHLRTRMCRLEAGCVTVALAPTPHGPLARSLRVGCRRHQKQTNPKKKQAHQNLGRTHQPAPPKKKSGEGESELQKKTAEDPPTVPTIRSYTQPLPLLFNVGQRPPIGAAMMGVVPLWTTLGRLGIIPFPEVGGTLSF